MKPSCSNSRKSYGQPITICTKSIKIVITTQINLIHIYHKMPPNDTITTADADTVATCIPCTTIPPSSDHLNAIMRTIIANYKEKKKNTRKRRIESTLLHEITTDEIYGFYNENGDYEPQKNNIFATLNSLEANEREMKPVHFVKGKETIQINEKGDKQLALAENEYSEYSGPLEEKGYGSYLCSFCEKVSVSGGYRCFSASCNRHSYCLTCTSFILRYLKSKDLQGRGVRMRKYSTNIEYVNRTMYPFRCVHALKDPKKPSACSWRNG